MRKQFNGRNRIAEASIRRIKEDEDDEILELDAIVPDDEEILELDFVPEEIGEVEVEKVLDPETLPIEHADEPVEMLDVFVVHNELLSDTEFYAIVDITDNDADTGITLVKLTEEQEVDHEATNELVQVVADILDSNGYEVVNINDYGVDANGTEGDVRDTFGADDEINVVAEADELELDIDVENPELEDDLDDIQNVANELDSPVTGGFEIVANPDGSVTFRGEPEVLLDVIFDDAMEEVKAELTDMPYVGNELETVIESIKREAKNLTMRKHR